MNETYRYKEKCLLITLSVMLAVFMGRVDGNIVLISLPTIAKFFNITASDSSWIMIVFTLALTGTLMFFGAVIDRFGVRKIFITGYIIFTLSSLFCGLSSSMSILLAARIIQGLGAAILLTSSMAVVSKFIPKNKTGWTFGLMSAAQSVGVASGAGLGGLIDGLSSWHWIFWVNIPIGIIAIIVALRVIPHDAAQKTEIKKRKIDIKGAILSFCAVFLFVFGLMRGPDIGWSSLYTAMIFLSAIVLCIYFIVHEKSCQHPLLDISLFKNTQFSQMVVAFFVVYLIGGFCILLPFYFETIKNFSPQQSGLTLMLYSILYMSSSICTGKAADKFNPYAICLGAVLLELIAAVFFSFTFDNAGYLYLAVFLAIFAIANGMFISPSNKIIMSFATPETKGMVSGLLNLLIGISTVIGMSTYGAIYSVFIDISKVFAFRAVGITSCVVFTISFIFCAMVWIGARQTKEGVLTKDATL